MGRVHVSRTLIFVYNESFFGLINKSECPKVFPGFTNSFCYFSWYFTIKWSGLAKILINIRLFFQFLSPRITINPLLYYYSRILFYSDLQWVLFLGSFSKSSVPIIFSSSADFLINTTSFANLRLVRTSPFILTPASFSQIVFLNTSSSTLLKRLGDRGSPSFTPLCT